MKKLIACLMVGLILACSAGFAAEWPAGRSPAQPYKGVPEVNLKETMGYIILYPREKLPVTSFCDVLEIYLPREDLALGEGFARLYEIIEGEKDPVEVCSIDFSNESEAAIRPLSEEEKVSLMWGSGSCVEMYLKKSLEFGDRVHHYYVLMDEGCFSADDGALQSISITNPEAWMPVISGEYGISGLYYIDAELPVVTAEPAQPADPFEDFPDVAVNDEPTPEPTDTPEPTAEPTAEPIDSSMYVSKRDIGDIIHFDLIIGGEIKFAVPYSENGSAEFDTVEYTESTHVVGRVVGEPLHWGVVFLNENGDVIDTLELGR